MQLKKLRTTFRRILITLLIVWSWPSLKSIIIGGSLVIIGQIIHFISAGYLVKKDELTTAGPYRFVRNPFYVGNLFYDIGLCIMAQNIYVAAIYLPLFYLGIIRARVRKEENFLLTRFGDAYREYTQKVPRFIPRLWPAQLNKTSGQFRWSQIIKHRELWRVMRAIGLILMFYLKSTLSFVPLKQIDLSILVQNSTNLIILIALIAILIIPPLCQYVIFGLIRKEKVETKTV